MIRDGSVFDALQIWYQSQCDGDWEHQHGIKIDTLDNPGWYGSIDINKCKVSATRKELLRVERDENDWLIVRLEDSKFEFDCGPLNLTEVIEFFLKWTETVEWVGEIEQ